MLASMATTRQWSDLPADILYVIANLCNSDTDLLRLRSTCSSWRFSLPRPQKSPISFPLKMPQFFTPYELSVMAESGICVTEGSHFILEETTFYRLSPPDPAHPDDYPYLDYYPPFSGWLLKLFETNPNTFSLIPTLSSEDRDCTPCAPNSMAESLNLLDYRISELCKSYTVASVAQIPSQGPHRTTMMYDFRKVLPLWNYVRDCDFGVLVLRDDGDLYFWKSGDEDWIHVDTNGHDFKDVILHDGKCHAIDSQGVLVSFDSELKMTVLIANSRYPDVGKRNYLVECKSDLYAVFERAPDDGEVDYDSDHYESFDAYEYATSAFSLMLCKFNKGNGKWDSAGDLGDMVFVLCDNASLSVSAKDFGGCKGNTVYLTCRLFTSNFYDQFCDKACVYDLDEQKAYALYLSAAQGFGQLFWPPPFWFDVQPFSHIWPFSRIWPSF